MFNYVLIMIFGANWPVTWWKAITPTYGHPQLKCRSRIAFEVEIRFSLEGRISQKNPLEILVYI